MWRRATFTLQNVYTTHTQKKQQPQSCCNNKYTKQQTDKNCSYGVFVWMHILIFIKFSVQIMCRQHTFTIPIWFIPFAHSKWSIFENNSAAYLTFTEIFRKWSILTKCKFNAKNKWIVQTILTVVEISKQFLFQRFKKLNTIHDAGYFIAL